MRGKHTILTLVVAAVAAMPAAGATWYVHGSYEPDTISDKDNGFMWETPDTDPNPNTRKIYFNAVPNLYFSGVNPNVGTPGAGTRVWTTPVQTYGAYLGVWKDCNADGFIGLADGALLDYSSALLSGSICPAGGEFNHDGWVSEFIWIGPGDVAVSNTKQAPSRLINDTAALVWGDWGLPFGAAPRGSCAVNPQPSGTYGSTGGVIYYVDCIANYRVTETVNSADPNCDLQLCLDPDSPQDDASLLNQRFPVHPFYDPYGDDPATPEDERTGLIEEGNQHENTVVPGDEPHEEDPAFQVWDCSEPEGTVGRDATGGVVGLPAVNGQPVSNPRGSYQDALNDTESGVSSDVAGREGCTGGETLLSGETSLEDNYGSSGVGRGKMDHDHYFSFSGGYAQLVDTCVFYNDPDFGTVPADCDATNRELYGAVGPTIDGPLNHDGGVGVTRFTNYGSVSPAWTSLPNWVTTPQLVRDDDLQPYGAEWVTFYAHLGDSLDGAAARNEAPNLYGAAWCGTAKSGIVRGWDCDPDHWWNATYHPDNTDMPTQSTHSDDKCYSASTNVRSNENCRDIGVRSGQPYQLRDIDCYDGRLARAAPAYASLALVAETCIDAP